LLVEVAAMQCKFWLGAAAILVLARGLGAAETTAETLDPASAANSPVSGATTPGATTPGATVAGESIARLIAQLDDPAFSARQSATQKLAELGRAALEHLAAAAAGKSREASLRSLDLLRQHAEAEDRSLQAAARQALQKLAASDNPALAQRAADALHPPEPPTIPVRVVVPRAVGGIRAIRPNNANIQFQFGARPAPGAAVRRVSVTEINGRRTVEVADRERSVKMETQPGGAIGVEVTETRNGQAATRKLAAADLADLKKQDPELGRVYEQYQKLGNPPIAPLAPPPFRLNPAPPNAAGGARLAGQAAAADAERRHVENLDRMIERLKQRSAADPGAQRIIESLEQSRQRFAGRVAPAQLKPAPLEPAQSKPARP
jgi:hypothetical protein